MPNPKSYHETYGSVALGIQAILARRNGFSFTEEHDIREDEYGCRD